MKFTKTTTMSLILAGALTLAGIGCDSNAGNGALIGGAAGAGLGAVIGHQSHGNTVGGAVIGGAAGAIGGALIGGEADRQQAEQRARERDDTYANGGPDYDRPADVNGYYDANGYYVASGYPVEGPPPPPRVEVVTVAPYPSAVWARGYWVRYPHHYIWVRGHWR